MYLSLHIKLNQLIEANVINVDFDIDKHVLKGEGTYKYKGQPVQILSNVEGSPPGNHDGLKFSTPHDVAWCPAHNTLLAYAEPPDEIFEPNKKSFKIKKR